MTAIITPAEVMAKKAENAHPPDWFFEMMNKLIHRYFENGMAFIQHERIMLHIEKQEPPTGTTYDDMVHWLVHPCWKAAGWLVQQKYERIGRDASGDCYVAIFIAISEWDRLRGGQ